MAYDAPQVVKRWFDHMSGLMGAEASSMERLQELAVQRRELVQVRRDAIPLDIKNAPSLVALQGKLAKTKLRNSGDMTCLTTRFFEITHTSLHL